MTGWWYTYPSEKYEFVSWDDDIPNIWKVIKFMFQTTNQITIIFPLLLVYNLLTTINISINHHIPTYITISDKQSVTNAHDHLHFGTFLLPAPWCSQGGATVR